SAREMRDYIRSKGIASEIYAYTIDESISSEAINFNTTQPNVTSEDVLILHFALPSGMTEFLKRSAARKAIVYHNITPSYYWLQNDRSLVHLAHAGRQELESLATFIDRAAADSEYNRQELEQLSFRNTCVVPIYVKEERYRISPSKYVMQQMNDGTFNMLF